MLLYCLLLVFWLVRLARATAIIPARSAYRRTAPPETRRFRAQRKPDWVRREIIRLKALLRDAGTCRAIADIFCRRFAAKRNMTVGRTFASEVIRGHRYEIDVVRRQIRNRKPRPVPN